MINLFFLFSFLRSDDNTVRFIRKFISKLLLEPSEREKFRFNVCNSRLEFDGMEMFESSKLNLKNKVSVNFKNPVGTYNFLYEAEYADIFKYIDEIIKDMSLFYTLIDSLDYKFMSVENEQFKILLKKIENYKSEIIKYFAIHETYRYKGLDHKEDHILDLVEGLIEYYKKKYHVSELISNCKYYIIFEIDGYLTKYVIPNFIIFDLKSISKEKICLAFIKYRMIRSGMTESEAVLDIKERISRIKN